jgi:Protein of unknown function (DUF3179)
VQLSKLIFLLLFFLFLAMKANSQIQNPSRVDPRWKTDTSIRSIELSEIKALLKRDVFPVFDNPTFINSKEADTVYFGREPVLAIEIEGKAKAYPLNVLTFHELANDELAGVPILASYCPLCNSAIVFDRTVLIGGEPEILEFGVSGMLRNSDMIMWDKKTESWWQQFTGEAIVGNLTYKDLEILPSMVLSKDEFFSQFPKGLILSKSNPENDDLTGAYGKNPYLEYDDPERKSFRLWGEIDDRLPPTERVVHVQVEGFTKLYPWHYLEKNGVINDEFHEEHIAIFFQKGVVSILDQEKIEDSKDVGTALAFSPWIDGKIVTFKKVGEDFIDNQTKSVWNISGQCISGRLKGREMNLLPHGQHFAFAWLSFYPDSEIYSE